MSTKSSAKWKGRRKWRILQKRANVLTVEYGCDFTQCRDHELKAAVMTAEKKNGIRWQEHPTKGETGQYEKINYDKLGLPQKRTEEV